MKVAACISGTARTFNLCKEKLFEYILNPTNADIFVHLKDDEDSRNIDFSFCKKVDIVEDEYIDEKNYVSRVGPGLHGGHIQQILQQMVSIKKCNEIKKTYEKDNGFIYDWVFRLRADIMYESKILELCNLDNSNIYVPKFAEWYGYNDRFAFGSSYNMDIYSARIDNFDNWFQQGNVFHPETYLGAYLKGKNIKVIEIPFYFKMLRKDGSLSG